MTTKPKAPNSAGDSVPAKPASEGGKKSPVAGGDGQSSSANSDDITNQENRPHNQLNGSGERSKKTSRKKWVPLAIDVRTSRGGRKERGSGAGPGAAGPGGAPSRSGGRTRNRDSISSKDAGPPANGESWRGDTERRATSFGKTPRGPRSGAPTVGGAPGAGAAVNGGPGYRRPHPAGGRRGGPGGAPGAPVAFKKGGEPGRMVNGKPEGPLTELKNGAPLYYVPASYRADPMTYLKECIRHQM